VVFIASGGACCNAVHLVPYTQSDHRTS
jgi:hypothetical protein